MSRVLRVSAPATARVLVKKETPKEEALDEDLQVLLTFIEEKGLVYPKDATKEFDVDKKTINSLLSKLQAKGLITRIEGENGTNPRYQVRKAGESARRAEREDDTGNRKKVDPQQVIGILVAEGPLRARDLAREMMGHDTKSAITALNSALSKLKLDGSVERFEVEDDEVHYRAI